MEPPPNPSATTSARPRRRRRWVWWSGGLLLLFLLLPVVAYLARGLLLFPYLAGVAGRTASEALAGEFTVERIEGGLGGRLSLHGVRTLRPGTATALSHLEAEEVRVDFSLGAWWRGEPDWIERVRVKGLRLGVDLEQAPPSEEPAAPLRAPAWMPPVELVDVALELGGAGIELAVPRARLALERRAPGFLLRVDAALDRAAAAGQRLDGAKLLAEAEWSGEGYALPRFELHLSHAGESLDARGRLDEAGLDAELEAGGLAIGPFAAAAGVELDGVLAVQGTLRLPWADPAGTEARLDLRADHLRAGFGELGRLRTRLEIADRRLLGGELELVAPDASLSLRGLSGSLDAGRDWAERLLEADLRGELRTPALAAWCERLGLPADALPPWAEQAVVVLEKRGAELGVPHAVVEGADGSLALDGAAATLALGAAGFELADLRLPLGGRLDRPWTVAQGIELPALTVAGTLGLDQALAPAALPAQLRLAVDGLLVASELGELRLDGELPLGLDGAPLAPGEVELALRWSGFDLPRAAPLLRWEDPPFETGRGSLALGLTGSWAAPRIELAVQGEGWLLGDSEEGLPAGPFALDLAAGYAEERAELRRCELGGAGLRSSAAGEWGLQLDLSALASGDFPFLGGPLRAAAELESEQFAWLAVVLPELRPNLSLAHATFELAGTGLQPELRADLRLEDLTLGATDPLHLELHAAHRDGRLELEDFHVEAEGLALRGRGAAPLGLFDGPLLGPGPVDLALELPGFALPRLEGLLRGWVAWPALDGELDAEIALRGDWQELELAGELRGTGLAGPVPGLATPLRADEFVVRLGWAGDSLTVQQISLRGPHARVDGDLALATATSPGAWLAGAPLGFGELAGRTVLLISDLSWLSGVEAVQRVAGRASADLTWSGPLDAPRFTGGFQLDDTSLRLTAPGLAALSSVQARGSFDADGVTLERLTGELGAEAFSADGRVDWAEGAPLLDLKLRGKDLLLYRAQGVKLRADTRLHLSGPLDAAVVGGRLALTDCRYVKKVDFLRLPVGGPSPPSPGGVQLFSLAPPLDGLRFDLEVGGAPGVLVDNNLVRGHLRPALTLSGTGAVPVLHGEVYLDDVAMSLPAARIVLEPSVVRFIPNDPFRPRLALRGSARRYGYDVQVAVNGPYDQPDVVLGSVPPMTQEELVLLLTTGQPPSQRIDAGGAVSTVAVFLAQDLLQTLFGDESTEAQETLLDRLEVYTGRDTTRQGEETIEGRFRLRDGFLFDADSLYLESERDAYGDFNIGLKLLIRFR